MKAGDEGDSCFTERKLSAKWQIAFAQVYIECQAIGFSVVDSVVVEPVVVASSPTITRSEHSVDSEFVEQLVRLNHDAVVGEPGYRC